MAKLYSYIAIAIKEGHHEEKHISRRA
jgi:hypothetical protein